MHKPLLLIVTGSPASGKTTLAHKLSAEIHCPLISRDELKEGLVNTWGPTPLPEGKSSDITVYDTFFETIRLWTSKGISLIAEAAFQDKLWRPQLLPLLDQADLRIILCSADHELLKKRFIHRLKSNPAREKYHGDPSARLSEELAQMIEHYHPPMLDVPLLAVNTTENYHPTLEQIIRFIHSERG